MNKFNWYKIVIWTVFGCILLLAAWLRVITVEETIVDHPIRADAQQYYLSAYNLVFNQTYSLSPEGFNRRGVTVDADAFRYPGLPLIIAASIWRNHEITPGDVPTVNVAGVLWDIQMVNVAAGVAAVGFIFFAARFALPRWAALGAALLTAISPHLVSFTVYQLTESISAMLTCLLLLATAVSIASRSESARRWGRSVGIGSIVGVLAMFRPIYLLCAPLITLASSRDCAWRKALAGALIGTILTASPWFIRNAVSVRDRGQPSYLAEALMDGAYPDYMLNGDPRTFPYPGLADSASRQARTSVMAVLYEIARRFSNDPLGMTAWYSFGTMSYLWRWDNVDGMGDVFIYPVIQTPFHSRAVFGVLHDTMKSSHWWLIILAVTGSIAVWIPATRDLLPRQGRPVLRAASLLLAYTAVMLMPFAPCTRYAVPVFPALFMMAMVLPAMALELVAVRRRRSLGSVG